MKKSLNTKYTFLCVLLIGLMAMTARNVTDPDVWWHLKTGQYIAEHKAVPHTDLFSFTRADTPWVAHEWLTELLLWWILRSTGWGGLILISGVVLCAAFSLLYLRCGGHFFTAGIVTLAGAWATAPLWGVRPQVFSLLLTSLWLLILERSEQNPRLLLWTLPLTVLWVNLHAAFALGLALSALFLAGDLLERILGDSTAPTAPNRPLLLSLALALDLLLVPLNPNGMRMYAYPIETLRSKAMQSYIVEWASPNFHRAEYWPFLFLLLAALVLFFLSSSQVRPRDLLLFLVGVYAALCSIRMIPLFTLIAVPIICHLLGTTTISRWRIFRKTPDPRSLSSRSHGYLNAVLILLVCAFTSARVAHVIRTQPQAEGRQFPVKAVAFVRSQALPGPIFNHYDWGGYLIWKLYPRQRVFIDGRADLYGEQFLHQYADTYELKRSWRQSLQDWGVQTVILPPDSALASGLRQAPGWRIAYEDTQAVVLTLNRSPIVCAGKVRLLYGSFIGGCKS